MSAPYTASVRLHWFSAWPPARDEAARRSRDVTRALAERGAVVTLVVADEAAQAEPAPPGVRLQGAGSYDAWAVGDPADLVVYQISTSAGAFLWRHLATRPGLAILQDLSLARACTAEAMRRPEAFRSIFAFSEPETSPDAAELAIAGFGGPYQALWPMTRLVIEQSRAVAVPTEADARTLQARWPDRPIVTLSAGIGDPTALDEAARLAARAELDLPAEAVVFGLTFAAADSPDTRRLPHVVRAFASTAARVPGAHLLVAADGTVDAPPDCRDRLRQLGPVTEEARTRLLTICDVLIDLRWPRSGGPGDDWLAAMAAGRPAVVIDSDAFDEWPLLDPRTWARSEARPPIGVAIDVLDEDHSLRAALYRLAIDPAIRRRLGEAARAFWQKTHTIERMAASALRAIDRARAAASPALDLPPHVRQALIENQLEPANVRDDISCRSH